MKTSVNETEVSLKSSCQSVDVFETVWSCSLKRFVFLIIRIIVDTDDYNDYNDYKDD